MNTLVFNSLPHIHLSCTGKQHFLDNPCWSTGKDKALCTQISCTGELAFLAFLNNQILINRGKNEFTVIKVYNHQLALYLYSSREKKS